MQDALELASRQSCWMASLPVITGLEMTLTGMDAEAANARNIAQQFADYIIGMKARLSKGIAAVLPR